MARPRKAQVEGAALPTSSGPVEHASATAFERSVASFRELYPDEWEAIRLCPTQHGVEIIAAKLKG